MPSCGSVPVLVNAVVVLRTGYRLINANVFRPQCRHRFVVASSALDMCMGLSVEQLTKTCRGQRKRMQRAGVFVPFDDEHQRSNRRLPGPTAVHVGEGNQSVIGGGTKDLSGF